MTILNELSPEEKNYARQLLTISYSADGSVESERRTMAVLNNPFRIDKSRFLPNGTPMNPKRFFETVKELCDTIRQKEGREKIPIVEEYPPTDISNIGTEIITFRIVKRAPANMSPDSSSRKHVKPLYYNSFEKEDVIEVFRRPLDHEIELCVWAMTNKAANETVLWLEEIMIGNTWLFKARGVDILEFKERLSDGYMNTDDNKIFFRPLRFFARMNEFLLRASAGIKEISLDLKIER